MKEALATTIQRFNKLLAEEPAIYSRTLSWLVTSSLWPHLSASQSYINRFRGAPSNEVPRIIPRQRLCDGHNVTFGSALMDALLFCSSLQHIIEGERLVKSSDPRKPPTRPNFHYVQQTRKALHKNNVATERSIAIHAAFIERMVQTNQPHIFECAQYNYAVLAAPTAKIWRLPLIAVAVTSGSAFMHEVNMISAQGSIDILNEALGAAVPELAAGALVAPSMLASFNQTLCTYNIWPVIPLIAWLVRTLVVHRVHHAPWCLVDMVGQKVVESLWTPNILGVTVQSRLARAWCGSAADAVTLCMLGMPSVHPTIAAVGIFYMLGQGFYSLAESVAFKLDSERSTADIRNWYNATGDVVERVHRRSVYPETLETRLLHSLQLADALNTATGSSSASQTPQNHDLAPLERIWAVPPVDTRVGKRYLPHSKPYAAVDVLIDSPDSWTSSRGWGWVGAIDPLEKIAQKMPWLADDELALEALIEARRSGANISSLQEEVLLERALVALSATIVASKDHGRLAVAPLRAETPIHAISRELAAEAMKADEEIVEEERLYSLMGHSELRPGVTEVEEYAVGRRRGMALQGEEREHMLRHVDKELRVKELLAQYLQSQTEGFINLLMAVDIIVGALKPLKKDVSPLHYHAGVIWFNAARAMEKPSELSSTTIPDFSSITAAELSSELVEIETEDEDKLDDVIPADFALKNDDARTQPEFELLSSELAQHAWNKAQEGDTGTVAHHNELHHLSEVSSNALSEARNDLSAKTRELLVRNEADGTKPEPSKEDWKKLVELRHKVKAMEMQLRDPSMDTHLKLQREHLRHKFLQQACNNFRVAQHTCLLKKVEMRGRISKSLGYTLVELQKDPVEALQALLRASRCLPRDITLLEDVQKVWHTTDFQSSLSKLKEREPERYAVRTRTLFLYSLTKLKARQKPWNKTEA